jgi:hypothetical protein
MKVLSIVLGSISVLLLGSTLLCGFWINSHTPAGVAPEASSITFHMQIAVATALFVLAALGVSIFAK